MKRTTPPIGSRRGPTGDRPDRSARWFVTASFVLLGLAFIVYVTADVTANPAPADRGVGPMGGRVLDLPMERSGLASAGGIEVTGSVVEMGVVPLDVTVVPTWTLVNRSSETIVLGEPHASVLEGCCPGTLDLVARRLEPGGSADLAFPLQMHRGMDGPHLFAIHVPVGVGGDYLELQVSGDFRD